MPSRDGWDSANAVTTETRAVRQDGESDLAYEHRDFKVRASKAVLNWGKGYSFCSTFNQLVEESGLAGYERNLGTLRGEDTEDAFQEWKTNTNRRLNELRHTHGYVNDETAKVLTEAGFDPNLGLPRRVKVRYTGTFNVERTVEVPEGVDVAERVSRRALISDSLYTATRGSNADRSGKGNGVEYEVEVLEDPATS